MRAFPERHTILSLRACAAQTGAAHAHQRTDHKLSQAVFGSRVAQARSKDSGMGSVDTYIETLRFNRGRHPARHAGVRSHAKKAGGRPGNEPSHEAVWFSLTLSCRGGNEKRHKRGITYTYTQCNYVRSREARPRADARNMMSYLMVANAQMSMPVDALGKCFRGRVYLASLP